MDSKAHLLLVKSRRNNALMLYSTHVLALEPAAGCTRTSFLLIYISLSYSPDGMNNLFVRQCQYHEFCFRSARPFLAVFLQHSGNLQWYVYMMQFLTLGLTRVSPSKKNRKSVRGPRCTSRNCSSVISSHGTSGFKTCIVNSPVMGATSA